MQINLLSLIDAVSLVAALPLLRRGAPSAQSHGRRHHHKHLERQRGSGGNSHGGHERVLLVLLALVVNLRQARWKYTTPN